MSFSEDNVDIYDENGTLLDIPISSETRRILKTHFDGDARRCDIRITSIKIRRTPLATIKFENFDDAFIKDLMIDIFKFEQRSRATLTFDEVRGHFLKFDTWFCSKLSHCLKMYMLTQLNRSELWKIEKKFRKMNYRSTVEHYCKRHHETLGYVVNTVFEKQKGFKKFVKNTSNTCHICFGPKYIFKKTFNSAEPIVSFERTSPDLSVKVDMKKHKDDLGPCHFVLNTTSDEVENYRKLHHKYRAYPAYTPVKSLYNNKYIGYIKYYEHEAHLFWGTSSVDTNIGWNFQKLVEDGYDLDFWKYVALSDWIESEQKIHEYFSANNLSF